ncbi:hypothetical protein QUB00_30290 [Microcoleus sp. F8_C2]
MLQPTSTFEPLVLIDNTDGTGTLSSEHYKDLHIIFDRSVVELLKDIDPSKYYFATNVRHSGEEWEISHSAPSNGIASSINFLRGTIKKDGEKIICTNPKEGAFL